MRDRDSRARSFWLEGVGLNSVRVQGKDNKYSLVEVLKVSPLSKEIDNSLRKKQLDLFKDDKRIRELEGIEPNRKSSKKT